MNDINNIFFELIRVAIGNAGCLSHTPTTAEWNALYAMAKEQSLVGICFAGVQRLQKQSQCPPEMLYLQWMGMAAKVQQRNEVVNQQCVDLQKRLSADGWRTSILKGQVVASFYSEHLQSLRQSGDIDIYIDGSRKDVLAYLKTIGFDNIDWDYVHCHPMFYKDTETELHYRPSSVRNLWMNARLQRFWKENNELFFAGTASLPNGNVVCPTKSMHLFFLIQHAYRHLISGGIGLRQMMDVYFALKCRDVADDEWLKDNLKRFGMTHFAEAMMWVMQTVFGLGMIDVPWATSMREGKFLLDEIMISGNFGKHDNRFAYGGSKVGIFKSIIRRNMHLASHYGDEALAAPFYYVWHFCWKRTRLYLRD